jgi:hypothetical protein
MAVITGRDGELRYQGSRVAKCRQFSIEVDRDALDTTTLGDEDRTYVSGLRGSSGTATVIYDDANAPTRNLLNSIFAANGSRSIELVLNTATSKKFTCNALLTKVGTPVSVGEVTACSIAFTVTGKPDGEF